MGKVQRKDTLTKGISSQFTAQFQGGNHVFRLWAPCLNNIAVVRVHEKDGPTLLPIMSSTCADNYRGPSLNAA